VRLEVLRWRAAIVMSLIAFAVFPSAAFAYPGEFPPVAGNPADRLTELPIDDYGYDYARECLRLPREGTLALQSWLAGHAAGTSWGIMRCEKLSRRNWSLHSEGRALDWQLDVHLPGDRRAARRLIGLMLASDSAGNPHALARRMGIQEIIWNCRAWWSGSEGLDPYSACYKDGRLRRVDDTTAHRNHIHFGLNWPGARLQTSFWAGR
jgi:hypothetical protein